MAARLDFFFATGAVVGWIIGGVGIFVFVCAFFFLGDVQETTEFSFDCPTRNRRVVFEVQDRKNHFGYKQTRIVLMDDDEHVRSFVAADFSMVEPRETEWLNESWLRLKTNQETPFRRLKLSDLVIDIEVVQGREEK